MNNSTAASTTCRSTTNRFSTSIVRSRSNFSLFSENNRKQDSRSRQTTAGLEFTGEDLTRNIGSDYQEIEIRTLTRWVNAQLKKVGDSIDNISTDLRDGKKLLKLLSVLSNVPAPKPERMNMRIHQLSNVAQALNFLEKHVGTDNMPDIGNEAIVNGDAKKTLALIFFIMLKYQIQLILLEHGEDFMQSLSELSKQENGLISQTSDLNTEASQAAAVNTSSSHTATKKISSSKQHSISGKSQQQQQHTSSSTEAKVALLYWVRIQLEDYIAANIIPSIQDFSRSWRTGVAFCLLIHRHNPAYIPDLFSVHLNADLSEKATWYQLLRLAFDLGSEKLGVEAYLEPEDLVNVDYPHEPSVMMYVSEFYKVISKYEKEEPLTIKRERAVKRKAAIAMVTGGEALDKNDRPFVNDSEEVVVRCASPTSLFQENNDKGDINMDIQQESSIPFSLTPVNCKKETVKQESTLNGTDKARIKADLNCKLLMQLTGHLPRGVHPVLDELITIHETVLSFIESNTKAISEYPELFSNLTEVSEYMNALKIITKQTEIEAEHLERANKAYAILTTPPENMNDAIIHLTESQQVQVTKLYNMLETEWEQFIKLLRITDKNMLTIKNTFLENEKNSEIYIAHAIDLEKELDNFREQLSHIAPLSSPSPISDYGANDKDTSDSAMSLRLHPLGGSQAVANAYQRELLLFIKRFTLFQDSTWKSFKTETNQLSRTVMQIVSPYSDRIMKSYELLVQDLEREQTLCENFQRGLTIASVIRNIEIELEEIQAMMSDDNCEKATTDDRIQMLETRVSTVRSTIDSIKEDYNDLLTNDERLIELFSGIQAKYETVNDWVDQVRVWFIEAQRVRKWIECRIELLQENNKLFTMDPLNVDFVPELWDNEETQKIYKEHEKLLGEVERFNKNDMTRLRSHVRTLTSSANCSLSPADVSTIEITLTTLTILDSLMCLLQQRTKLVEALRSRLLWENLIVKANKWCQQKEIEIIEFMKTKARWSEPREDETPIVILKRNTEEIVQILISLEHSIDKFDKSDYSAVLDAYQGMEDIEEDLPDDLTKREEEFERQFELIMKRCALARKIVEQYLVVSDTIVQFRKLKVQGEKLKLAMMNSNSISFKVADSSSFSESVQLFKDNSSHWLTVSLKRIPYPKTPTELSDFFEINEADNNVIRHQMCNKLTYLAEITEELDKLLSFYRENLPLQERASSAYNDVLRINAWIEERLRILQKFDASILKEDKLVVLEDIALDRLEKEQEEISSRFQQIESHDINKALEVVHLLETEIDKVNSISIDRNALVTSIGELKCKTAQLKAALELRTHEIIILRRRISWESQWEEVHCSIYDLASQLWDFYSRYAQYDIEGLKKRESNKSTIFQDDVVQKDILFSQLSEQVLKLENDFPILSSNSTVFERLQEAYSVYSHLCINVTNTIEYINLKQMSIKTEYQHLQQLLDNVYNTMKQCDVISSFNTSYDQVIIDGELAIKALHKILRGSLVNTENRNKPITTLTLQSVSDINKRNDEKIMESLTSIKYQISQLCKQSETFQYLNNDCLFEDLIQQTLLKPVDYNQQIKELISRKIDTLLKMNEAIDNLLVSYRNADSMIQEFYKCQEEALNIQQWFDNTMLSLNNVHIDVASTSFDLSQHIILDSRSKITQLLTILKQKESSDIVSFQEKIEWLVSKVKENTEANMEGIIDAYKDLNENVLRGISVLFQSAVTQTQVLDAAEARLKWEAEINDVNHIIQLLNNQLQQYILKKNKCVAQQEDLLKDTIEELELERSQIDNQLQMIKANRLPTLTEYYIQMESCFVKLPLIKVIPIHMKERAEALSHSLQKVDEANLWRGKELDYIYQRYDLENNIKKAADSLSQYVKLINHLIETKGRWNFNGDFDIHYQQVIKETNAEWMTLNQKFNSFCDTILYNIKQKNQNLQEISAAMQPGFMLELHQKNIELLSQTESSIEADFSFALKVILQKEQIAVILTKSSQLEKNAEMIHEILLPSTIKSDFQSTSSTYEPAKEVEKFTQQVNDLKLYSKTELLMPKRSNDKNQAISIKVKDKTMNSVIQDIISTKFEILDGLVESLSALIKSREAFSQLQYVMNAFKKQASVCQSWILLRQDTLEKSIQLLDDDNVLLKPDNLRDAVSEADSIQMAMTAHDNNYILLCKHKEKYIAYFDQQTLFDNTDDGDYNCVMEIFDKISCQWNDLLTEIRGISHALSSALLPAEVNYRIATLISSFESLNNQIHSTEVHLVTDNELSGWQKRIDFLETKEYNQLLSQMNEYKHSMTVESIESLIAQLDHAGDIILEIRGALTFLYDAINSNHLFITHIENSELFHTCAEKQIMLIDELQYDKLQLVTNIKRTEERLYHFQTLTEKHKQIQDTIIECQGFYEDSCSYYNIIKLQNVVTAKSDDAQQTVEATWKKILLKVSEFSSFTTRTSKWIEACEKLDKLENILKALKSEINKVADNSIHTSTITNNKMKKYKQQLLKISINQEELDNTVKNTNDLCKDINNKNEFLKCSQQVHTLRESIQMSLNKKRMDKERINLFELYKTEVAKVLKICEDQITYIQQQVNTNPEYHLKKAETINNTINVYSTALLHIQDKYNECKLKCDGVISNQASRLLKVLGHPYSVIKEYEANLANRMEELKLSLKTEQNYITVLKLLSHLLKNDKEIIRSINELKATVSYSYNGNRLNYRTTRARNLPELEEFMQRYEQIEISIQKFNQNSNDLKQKLNKHEKSTRAKIIIKIIDKHVDDIDKRWTEIELSADDTRKRLNVLHKRQIVYSKINESLKYVNNLRDRVEALQLSGKSIFVEEQELDKVQDEIDRVLIKDIDDIDALLKCISQEEMPKALTTSTSEVALINQRDSLASSIDNLCQLLVHRREQVHTEGSITEFFGTIELIDEEIAKLYIIIEKTSVQNANVIGSKFDKADLQSLLKRLTSSYKKSEQNVTSFFEKARFESQKQFLHDNERVAKQLLKTLNDWSTVQASYVSREKELQACIRELNHEFFTKLAIAKTLPKKRTPRYQSQYTNTKSGSRNFKSPTFSTEKKISSTDQLFSRTSKARNNAVSYYDGTKYIPDPKNELDVQLGLILNKSPYRIKVKMVPGEVGKYWFGEEHPKLIYCRILSSKTVMVRVGGGWIELSK
ncbi:uncharacterized protein BX663DRAFT_511243 [Cokeromyces recurvatus]|uniref:uncharacterized protein n=1 Tax=Cokeromyces recurvatus TaxID=90255 RepID=UPI00221EBD58|nr:uncharacterized protein BX663DRAFT_511243 [Cokeromyces recurvatus]KAI7902493.1 hypothetical protein BX663DRAFT_511243 [Cokeromyces recurvatus]